MKSVKFSRSKDLITKKVMGKKGESCPKDGHKEIDEIGCILRD